MATDSIDKHRVGTPPSMEKKEEVSEKVAVQPVVVTPPQSTLQEAPTTRWAKIVVHWHEFRKRYLTPRRIIFWSFWIGIHTGLFVYGWLRQGRDPRLALTNTIGYSVSMSRGAGLCIAFDTALILFPMLRTIITTIYPKFDFLALDENIWFHRQTAYALLFFVVVHVTGFYVNYYRIEELKIRPETAYEMLYKSWAGITGWIMCLVMFLMYTTSNKEIRVMNFETFKYTHFLYWVFFIALLCHAAGCFVSTKSINSYNPAIANIEDEGRKQCLGYNSWRYVLVGLLLYIASLLWGMYRSFRKTDVNTVIVHPERVIEIRFVKPTFKYLSGQWVWLNVPAISRMQYHPFTITSAPSDGYVSLHIRCVGDWTDELAQYVGATQEVEATATSTGLALSVPVNLKIHIDGPFGAPAELVYREQAVLCVGAGIGITPWASVLKDIWYAAIWEESDCRARLKNNTAQKVMLRRVELIWVCQNINQLQWFANLLATMQQEMSQIDPKCFTIHIYLTRTDRKDKVPFQLRTNTSFGRPNWNTVIGNVRAAIDAGEYMDDHPSRVGVYLCGGYRLGKELAKTCRKYTDRKFRFRFKKEHF